MEMSTGQALIIALWVALVESRILLGGATTNLRFSPMMTGLVCGIVLGDVGTALKITAAIQLIYMGVFAPGGQMPSEPCVAAAIAVPVALLGGMDPKAAVAVAVPVGLLGGYLYQFRLFVNTFINRFADRGVEKMNEKEISRAAILYPFLISLVLFAPFMFVALKFGAPFIANLVNANSSSLVFHVLTVIGGGLVAIGIAVTVYVIGKKSYIPFFLLGYFLTITLSSLNITMLTYAVIGILIAAIFVLLKNEAVTESEGGQ